MCKEIVGAETINKKNIATIDWTSLLTYLNRSLPSNFLNTPPPLGGSENQQPTLGQILTISPPIFVLFPLQPLPENTVNTTNTENTSLSPNLDILMTSTLPQ